MPVTTAPLLSGSILDEEIELETSAITEGVKRYNILAADAVKRGAGAELKPAEHLALFWFEPLKALLSHIVSECKAGREPVKGASKWGPVFKDADPAAASYITIHRALSGCMAEPEGASVASLAYHIGDAIVAELNAAVFRKDHRDEYEALTRRIRDLNPYHINRWARQSLDNPRWSRAVCVHIGAACLDMLTRASFLDNAPAFVLTRRRRRGFEVLSLTMSETARRLIDRGHDVRKSLRPRYLPMIVAPYPWVQTKDEHGNHIIEGGYARIRTPYISKITREQRIAIDGADLTLINECRTALESTGWHVNRRVLGVAKEMIRQGGGVANLPRSNDIPMPPHPPGFDDSIPLGRPGRWKNVEPDVKAAYKKAAADTIRQNIDAAPARKSLFDTMGVAERFEDCEAFYFPHQFDFRGRCYPIPPALNHHGDDLRRGLLEFAEAKEPGKAGDRELMIEAANCYGVDKVSYDDRVQWAAGNLAQIARVAKDPLADDWWHPKYDGTGRQVGGPKKPWQFLAACIALFDKDAASHAPVRRDGTCNGLQHYAALARDEAAAAAVNLIPGRKPASVYSDVAEAVRPLVADDAARSDRVLSFHDFKLKTDVQVMVSDLASALFDLVDKDTIKQPVMTQVYGVTSTGARKQIQEQLKARGFDGKRRYIAARYLAEKVIEGMGSACAGATAIMEWLRSCARAIVATSNPVAWTTPLGLPVVQPYRQKKRAEVHTGIGVLNLRIREDWLPIDATKQINGVAPNFIHPIDKSHMLLVARDCRKAVVTFAAVHDQYWGHAADELHRARINREQFVALHERDILGDLHREWSRRNPGLKFEPPPPRGKLDIRQVLNSPYFFS